MKNKKPYERYDPLLQEIVRAHNTICRTYDLQQELNVPVDITKKLDFVLRTLNSTLGDIEQLKNTEEFLWQENLSQFKLV